MNEEEEEVRFDSGSVIIRSFGRHSVILMHEKSGYCTCTAGVFSR